MSTTEDEEPPEKKYCCGNAAQNEAGYVSKCDIAIVVNGLVSYTLVTVLLFVNDAKILKEYIDNNPAMSDLHHLIDAELLHRILFLTASLIWLLFELGLAILLLRGSTLRNKVMLRRWFNLTIGVCVIGITVSGFAVYYLKEKNYVGVGAFIYYLYKWYGLWICTELISEIKQGINPYAIHCEFGTSF